MATYFTDMVTRYLLVVLQIFLVGKCESERFVES